jgi:antitoxin component YwqK of YwqJK toxin-antitoxin module
MKTTLPVLLLSALAVVSGHAHPTEHVDRQGQRQGRYRTYYDEARTQLFTRGRYRHGQPVGRWRYYAQAGELQRQERYRRHGYSNIVYYHPGGQVARRGRARVVEEQAGPHFYWLGEWQYFSPTGRLDSVQVYSLGKRVASHLPAASQGLPLK